MVEYETRRDPLIIPLPASLLPHVRRRSKLSDLTSGLILSLLLPLIHRLLPRLLLLQSTLLLLVSMSPGLEFRYRGVMSITLEVSRRAMETTGELKGGRAR